MKSIKEKLGHYSWDIAYGIYTSEILHKGLVGTEIKVVKNPYKNKWFADPFILDEDNATFQLLVEEFDYSVKRGRIARIVVDKEKSAIIDLSIILDLPTHLSFPVIYRRDGEIFVHPENSASGVSNIYRYDKVIDKLVDPVMLIREPLTDAVIRVDKNKFSMFATKVPDPNGCVLHEYSSDNFFGPYQPFREIIYPNNSARMAGMFIVSDDSVIRPAQDCLQRYGNAVIMYNEQEPLCRITPQNYKYAGIHTFNVFGELFIIDLKKYDNSMLYQLAKMIRS